MALPLHERAKSAIDDPLVRFTATGLLQIAGRGLDRTTLIPERTLVEGEQYRFHFNMTKCIGCRSCEVACNEQNGNPAEINWRRIGELEGGVYPDTQRTYLSMGCNHCLDAECLKGCPVDAYTKDPATGIVLHSADACIGCQYCVWNCPYGVPEFNPDRGVVGKCDMCHGRLTDGLEPACVNACPEAAIEIEIVNMAAWRADFSTAESPGMPAAIHTISTTRITLPADTSVVLDRVDGGSIVPEHAHLSLVFMTTLIQSVVGAFLFSLLRGQLTPLLLTSMLLITAVALNISVFHLGRPAYAWRALKMWRRSWLSREVLLFGLFFGALAATTLTAWPVYLRTSAAHFEAQPLPSFLAGAYAPAWVGQLLPWLLHTVRVLPLPAPALPSLAWIATLLGIGGIVASAFIYLIPARPAWNMVHTPIDFLLSTALLGATLPIALINALSAMLSVRVLQPYYVSEWMGASSSANRHSHGIASGLALAAALLWCSNHALRVIRLNRSSLFEHRAAGSLLNTPKLRAFLIASFAMGIASSVLALFGMFGSATVAAFGAVLFGRYLFFVSVVPLNMALTFVRAKAA